MTKKQKLTLIVIIPIIIILIIFVAVLGIFKKEDPVSVEYPPSELSDSIFDSQNMLYTPNEAFALKHSFELIPYTIDTVDTDKAEIGTGSVYAYNDYYFYYSLAPKGTGTRDVVREQFSQVLNYGVDADKCTVDVLLTETGFINGFVAEYQVDHIAVPSDTEIRDAYIVCYRLAVEDDDELQDDYDIIVAVATRQFTTEALAGCKSALDKDVFTLQYDSMLQKELVKIAEEKEEILNGENNDSINSDNSSDENSELDYEDGNTENSDGAGELVNEAVMEDFKTMGILLKENYADLTLEVTWTNPGTKPKLIFSDVAEKNVFEPDVVEDGCAKFHIGKIEGGVYMVKITDYVDAGSFSSMLIENGQEAE